MTPFLVAAKNGIVEMVNEILIKIPSAIHNTTSRKENVLLVAVKYRQPLIVETLRMIKHSKPELWNNLILAMDEDENTVLHLAAEALGGDKPWQIAGSALQMMWDIKWFQVHKMYNLYLFQVKMFVHVDPCDYFLFMLNWSSTSKALCHNTSFSETTAVAKHQEKFSRKHTKVL